MNWSPAWSISKVYDFELPVADSSDRSSTQTPCPSGGASEFLRLTRPQPSLLLGISRLPTSSAPRISKPFTKAPCGESLKAISSRYSLIIAAAPAAFGVAMEVPVYSRYQVVRPDAPPVSVASWARHDHT